MLNRQGSESGSETSGSGSGSGSKEEAKFETETVVVPREEEKPFSGNYTRVSEEKKMQSEE